MAIEKFGKYVELRVYHRSNNGKSGELLFSSVSDSPIVGSPSTDRLRVDFEYKQWNRYGRAKVSVYNINTDTQSKIVGTEGLEFEVLVGLHGAIPERLGDRMSLSNVLTVKAVPDSITTLYGFTSRKVENLEKKVLGSSKPGATVKEVIEQVCLLGQNDGTVPSTDFLRFPEKILNLKYTKAYPYNKTLEFLLDEISTENKFYYYINERGYRFIYMPVKPDAEEANDLREAPESTKLKLEVANMRSNPVISIGALTVTMNLDRTIESTRVIDTSNFITNESGESLTVLQHARDIISLAKRFVNYQVVLVDHKGSTHTKSWDTKLTAYGPSNGTNSKLVDN